MEGSMVVGLCMFFLEGIEVVVTQMFDFVIEIIMLVARSV